jgi:hypothetical protein
LLLFVVKGDHGLLLGLGDDGLARGRARASGAVPAPGRLGPTLVVVFGGLIAWAVFAMWAHRVLIGVRPFG